MNDYIEYGYESGRASHIEGYVFDPIIQQLDPQRETCILDVGCGNGWMVRKLCDLGFDAFGIDASEDGIQIAKEYYPDRFFVQDVRSKELPVQLGDKSFDVVISTEVIEHLYNPGAFLDFLAGILTSNDSGSGKIILTTPYHGYIKNLILALSGKMDQHFHALWVGGHIKFFSRKSLTELLGKHGFEVLHFQGCGRLPYLWKSMLVKARLK